MDNRKHKRKHKNRLATSAWYFISKYQQLDQDFMSEFKDHLDWRELSKVQVMTEEFILKHKDLVYWPNILIHQKLSTNFIRQYYNDFSI